MTASIENSIDPPPNLSLLVLSRNLMHASLILPSLLYHGACAMDDAPSAASAWHGECRFPATISATISAGAPKLAQHALWLAGWAAFGAAVRRCGAGLRRFAAQMMLTGVVALVLFPEGHGARADAARRAFASAYVVDHWFLIRYLGVRRPFRRGFLGCGLLFGVATVAVNACKEHGAAALCAPDGWGWWWRFWEMCFEYGAIVSFICGMASLESSAKDR